jgi:hypothetical protein
MTAELSVIGGLFFMCFTVIAWQAVEARRERQRRRRMLARKYRDRSHVRLVNGKLVD